MFLIEIEFPSEKNRAELILLFFYGILRLFHVLCTFKLYRICCHRKIIIFLQKRFYSKSFIFTAFIFIFIFLLFVIITTLDMYKQ